MSSISALTSPSSSTSALLMDDTFMGFRSEVDLSFENIFEVQDQLCQLLEIKQKRTCGSGWRCDGMNGCQEGFNSVLSKCSVSKNVGEKWCGDQKMVVLSKCQFSFSLILELT